MRKIIRRMCVIYALFLLLSMAFFQPGISHADDIDARAAVVIDGNSGRILFAKNPNAKLQPASTTKLVTAMVAIDNISPDEVVTVSKNAASTQSVSPRLRPGEKLTVRDLLSLALIRSVNSAAVALAEAVSGSEGKFVRLMNEKAKAIGAENTKFVNSSGLPGDGQHITAFDLALIMKEALRYPLIREIISTKTDKIYTEDGRSLNVKNTNHMLWNDEDALGGKTGYTRSAGHCLVFASQKGNSLLVASLLGETSRNKVWENSSTLLAFGEDVIGGRRQPEIYYTSDVDRPFMLAAKRRSSDSRGKLRHLVSKKKVTAEKGKPKNVSKKANKKERVAKLAKSKMKSKKKTVTVKNGGRKKTRDS